MVINTHKYTSNHYSNNLVDLPHPLLLLDQRIPHFPRQRGLHHHIRPEQRGVDEQHHCSESHEHLPMIHPYEDLRHFELEVQGVGEAVVEGREEGSAEVEDRGDYIIEGAEKEDPKGGAVL